MRPVELGRRDERREGGVAVAVGAGVVGGRRGVEGLRESLDMLSFR